MVDETDELAVLKSRIDGARSDIRNAKSEIRDGFEAGNVLADAQERIATAAASLVMLEDCRAQYEARLKQRYVRVWLWLCRKIHGNSARLKGLVVGICRRIAAILQAPGVVVMLSPDAMRADFDSQYGRGWGARRGPKVDNLETDKALAAFGISVSDEKIWSHLMALGSRKVTLDPKQQEMAKVAFPYMSPRMAYANYARNLLVLQAEGALGRVTH